MLADTRERGQMPKTISRRRIRKVLARCVPIGLALLQPSKAWGTDKASAPTASAGTRRAEAASAGAEAEAAVAASPAGVGEVEAAAEAVDGDEKAEPRRRSRARFSGCHIRRAGSEKVRVP